MFTQLKKISPKIWILYKFSNLSLGKWIVWKFTINYRPEEGSGAVKTLTNTNVLLIHYTTRLGKIDKISQLLKFIKDFLNSSFYQFIQIPNEHLIR